MLLFIKKLLSIVWILTIDLTIMLSVFSLVSQFAISEFNAPDYVALVVGMIASMLVFGHLKFRNKIVQVIQGKWFSRSTGLYGIWMRPEFWATENGGTDIIGSRRELELLLQEWKNEMPIEQFKQYRYQVKEYK